MRARVGDGSVHAIRNGFGSTCFILLFVEGDSDAAPEPDILIKYRCTSQHRS